MIKCHNWAPITHGCITVKGNKFPMWLARYLHKTPRRSLECTQDAWQIFQYVQQIWGCAWVGQQTLSLCWGHLAGSTTWNLSDMPGSSFHTQFQFPQQGCDPSQVPTDVAVWEISFLPITQHPQTPVTTFHAIKCLQEDACSWESLTKVTEWLHLSDYIYILFTLHNWLFCSPFECTHINILK